MQTKSVEIAFRKTTNRNASTLQDWERGKRADLQMRQLIFKTGQNSRILKWDKKPD